MKTQEKQRESAAALALFRMGHNGKGLPRGYNYIAHNGSKERARRLRQMERDAARKK